MSGKSLAEYLEDLSGKAREASIAEQEFDREVARRRAEIVEARAFAWRRVSLIRALSTEMKRHEEDEAAIAAARRVFCRELGWTALTEGQKEALEQFAPVLQAMRAALREDSEGDAEAVALAFAEFEAWYQANRQASFLSLMQREVVELPLVEV